MQRIQSHGLNAVLRILSDRTRRRLLVAMLERPSRDAVVRVPDAVHRGDSPIDQLEIELAHNHLPALEDAGIVRWKRGAGEVTPGPAFEEIRPVVELLDEHREVLPADWI